MNTTGINITSAAAPHLEQPEPQAAAATASKIKSEKSPPDPPPDDARLKDALKAFDPNFLFDKAFYPRAAAFIAAHAFDPGYPEWLYKLCLKKKPNSISGYYYSVFCEERFAELYRAAACPKPPPQVPAVLCPVCETSHPADTPCPACGLPENRRNNPDEIKRFAKLYALPPDKKQDYEREVEQALGLLHAKNADAPADLEAVFRRLAAIDRKYGLAE